MSVEGGGKYILNIINNKQIPKEKNNYKNINI